MGFLAGPLTPVLDAWQPGQEVSVYDLILTLIVRLLLFPLQVKSMKSAAKMRDPAEAEGAAGKVQGQSEELQRRMVALYQQHNMNPRRLLAHADPASRHGQSVRRPGPVRRTVRQQPRTTAAGIAVTFLVSICSRRASSWESRRSYVAAMTFSVPGIPCSAG